MSVCWIRQCLEMIEKPFAESAERNSAPILEVLRTEFSACSAVLEIGSGTGQHAARFAAELPNLLWQTSDLEENHAGINSWVDGAKLTNLQMPLSLDVFTAELPGSSYDAVFSANTAHIMSIVGAEKMFELVATVLTQSGVFCLYGPFRQGGEFNTPSNAAFHESLRARNSDMGIRHLEVLDQFGSTNGLSRVRLYAMPANNHLAVWHKGNS